MGKNKYNKTNNIMKFVKSADERYGGWEVECSTKRVSFLIGRFVIILIPQHQHIASDQVSLIILGYSSDCCE